MILGQSVFQRDAAVSDNFSENVDFDCSLQETYVPHFDPLRWHWILFIFLIATYFKNTFKKIWTVVIKKKILDKLFTFEEVVPTNLFEDT